jgi:hypothetical protein
MRATTIALLTPLLACGGSTNTVGTEPPASPAAEASREAAHVELPEANVILLGFALTIPNLPTAAMSVELRSDEEELTLTVHAADRSVDETVNDVRITMEAIVGVPMAEVPIEVGGREGKMISGVGESNGAPFAFGFALAPCGEDQQVRFSYQVRGTQDAGGTLERVMASLTTTRVSTATAEGFRIVSIGGMYVEAPARLSFGTADHLFEASGSVKAHVIAQPAEGEEPRVALTENSVGQARTVSDVQSRQIAFAGGRATLTTYTVSLSEPEPEMGRDAGPTYPEYLVETPLPGGRFFYMRGRRLPETVVFEDVLATVRRLD